jgi:Phage capsid-like protein
MTLERARFRTMLESSPELRAGFEALVRQREDEKKSNRYGEAAIDVTSYQEDFPELPSTFVDYDDTPRQYQLGVLQTVIRLHSRVTDLYNNNNYDQLREQLRLTIETMKEQQESEIINDPRYGLLNAAMPSMRIRTRSGPPTPDDLDDLLSRVWKEPAFFLAHPRAIAAFGRECTRRGVPPPTVNIFGSPFLTWRGVPLIPSDKLPVNHNLARLPHAANRGMDRSAGLTSILLMRVGEHKQGVIGLQQIGLPGEQVPGLSVRFMGIDEYSTASYLVTLYFSAAVLTEDALGVLEGVEVGNYHDYE